MDHHRSEVGDIGHDLPCAFRRHALVRSGFGVRSREFLNQFRIQRRHDRRLIKIKTECRLPSPYLGLVAEQDQVRDTAPEQDGRGFENPIIIAFRQYDPLPIGAGALHELILEHQRGTDIGGRNIDRRKQSRLINLLGKHPTGSLDLPTRLRRNGPTDAHQPLGRRKSAEVGHGDWQVLLDAFGQPSDALGNLVSAGEQDAGECRERARLVGKHQAGKQIGTVAGSDHRDIREKSIKDVRQAHRRHDYTQSLAIHPSLGTQHQLAVGSLHQCPESRRRQQRALRNGSSHNIAKLGKLVANRLYRSMIDTIRDHSHGLRMIGP